MHKGIHIDFICMLTANSAIRAGVDLTTSFDRLEFSSVPQRILAR
jgi:hypothetical protein